MDSHLKIATYLTKFLDARFNIFGFKFGFDPLIGTIPIVGDIIPFILSLYIIWIGIQMRIPNEKIAMMLKNTVLDLFLGAIPLIGDLTDFFYKANLKNLKILNEALEEAKHKTPKIFEGKLASA